MSTTRSSKTSTRSRAAGRARKGLTTVELSRRLAEHESDPITITPQTVRNYHAAGMPACGKIQRRGLTIPVFNETETRTWIAANRQATLHGGRRRRAGRKRKRDPAPRLDHDAAEKKQQARDLLGELRAAAESQTDPLDLERGLLGLSEVQLAVLARIEPEISGFTVSAAARLQQLIRAKKDQLEIDRQSGLLLDAADVARTWSRHMETIRRGLEGLPARAAPAVVAACELPPGRVPIVKETLRAVVDELLRAMADGEVAAGPQQSRRSRPGRNRAGEPGTGEQ